MTLQGERFEIQINDDNYPASFYQLNNIGSMAPSTIYALGDPSVFDTPSIAMIGPRNASDYAHDLCALCAAEVANAGLALVSGGSRGASTTALEAHVSSGGIAIVVFGSGVDVVYPEENFDLFQAVIDNGGVVISEHPWNNPPIPNAFRHRLRLISALSDALFIPECNFPSGTFSAAEVAYDLGIPVWVPSDDDEEHASDGCSAMLDDELAYPVSGVDGFREALAQVG